MFDKSTNHSLPDLRRCGASEFVAASSRRGVNWRDGAETTVVPLSFG
jgi:hypothetical protein